MAEKKYTQSVTSTGGGRDGRISGDGQMNMDLRPLDSKEEGANPEALLAAAWAACFNGALQKTMKEEGVDVDTHTPSVTAHVSFYTLDDGGLKLGAVLEASFENQSDIDDIEGLLRKTHDFCPVSKAYRGDLVELKVSPAA